MNTRMQTATWNWWGFAFAVTFGSLCAVLILTGVVGGTVWWTAAAMGLLAVSSLLNIRAITRNNRKVAAALATPPSQ